MITPIAYFERITRMATASNRSYQEDILDAVDEIKELKREKNAVVLSHYYMEPALQVLEKDGGFADYTGDSLGLSIEATKTEAENIVFCGVNFMAETAHILNPDKNVYIPDRNAGCSLASSINAEDVKRLKANIIRRLISTRKGYASWSTLGFILSVETSPL